MKNLKNTLSLLGGIFFIDVVLKRSIYPSPAASLNEGFGSFPSVPPWFVLVGVCVTLFFFILLLISAHRGKPVIGYLLITAGAASNMLDRLQFGGVIDYISLPIFMMHANVSDMMIAVGILMLVIKFKHEIYL